MIVTPRGLRRLGAILLAVTALPAAPAAAANERGQVIRAGDLYTQPFIDAPKAGALAPNQAVTIVERRGGWVSVDAGGRRGWVRLLNVRLESVAPGAGKSTARLRTGSTGRTVATGVKGLEEADIRAAAIDRAQLERLEALGASEAQARQAAADYKLTEHKLDYLKKGKGS